MTLLTNTFDDFRGPQRYSRASRIARIEAEQKRRDETKAAYARLKNALPVSAQKNSKAILLDRGMLHVYLYPLNFLYSFLGVSHRSYIVHTPA